MKRKHQLVLVLLVLFVLLTGYHAYAIYGEIEWSSGLGIYLPAYNSVIDADNSMYFSGFTWNNTNATQTTFADFYMGTDSNSIISLTISTTSNITLSKVSNIEIYYLSALNGTQVFSIVDKPENVTIDGVNRPENYYWTFSNGFLTVTNAVVDVDVLFASNALTADQAAGIAVALFLLAIGVCVGLIFTLRRKRENEIENL